MAHFRDRRAFGNVNGRRFRGARYGDGKSPRFTGLLDLYGGASAAYSLRALSRGWLAGDVVEVRRSSDSATADFTASQVSGGALATWVGAGNDGFVSTWYDQSGNANDATQGTTTAQPKIVDAGALVTGGLDFDGVDDTLGTNIFTSSSQPISKFAVGSFDSITAATYFIDGSADNRGVIGAAAAGTWRIFAGGTADDYSTSISLATDYLTSGIFNGASTNLQVNGSNLGNKSVGTDGLDEVQIGSGNVGGGAFLDGKIAEVIVYNTDQSANRVGIETNINNHYSIY